MPIWPMCWYFGPDALCDLFAQSGRTVIKQLTVLIHLLKAGSISFRKAALSICNWAMKLPSSNSALWWGNTQAILSEPWESWSATLF